MRTWVTLARVTPSRRAISAWRDCAGVELLPPSEGLAERFDHGQRLSSKKHKLIICSLSHKAAVALVRAGLDTFFTFAPNRDSARQLLETVLCVSSTVQEVAGS